MPSFTHGKKQQDVEKSQLLSMVRIHVEQVIGLLKNRYHILKGPIPVPYQTQEVSNMYVVDKILVVHSA